MLTAGLGMGGAQPLAVNERRRRLVVEVIMTAQTQAEIGYVTR